MIMHGAEAVGGEKVVGMPGCEPTTPAPSVNDAPHDHDTIFILVDQLYAAPGSADGWRDFLADLWVALDAWPEARPLGLQPRWRSLRLAKSGWAKTGVHSQAQLMRRVLVSQPLEL
jgi:hypothetical protein